MDDTVLLVPGLRGSGPAHWQSLWQAKHPAFRRVLQREWGAARLEDWSAAVDEAVRAAHGRVFIVAHGFGCLASLRRLGCDEAQGHFVSMPLSADDIPAWLRARGGPG